MRRRLAAVFALVVGVATVALAIAVAVSQFPRGLVLLGCVLIAGGVRLVRRAAAGGRAGGGAGCGWPRARRCGRSCHCGPDRRLVDLLVVAGLLVIAGGLG